MSRIKEGSDINVGSIEEDIKRCEELIKTEHANWIGISNQLAIAHVVDRVKELEAKLEFKNWGDLDNIQFEEYMNQFIPKQKVKDLLKEIEKEHNKVQEQFDCIWNKKSKDNYDRYKLQKLSAMQQELGFILGKLE